eukprot:12923145-Prorocentrum_lima.AAC.1
MQTKTAGYYTTANGRAEIFWHLEEKSNTILDTCWHFVEVSVLGCLSSCVSVKAASTGDVFAR